MGRKKGAALPRVCAPSGAPEGALPRSLVLRKLTRPMGTSYITAAEMPRRAERHAGVRSIRMIMMMVMIPR